MINQEQTDIELETVEAQHLIELADALEELEGSPAFQKVILDGYMKDKVLDSVSLLAEPMIKQRGERPDVMEDLVAISNLQYYFKMIKNLGAGAKLDMEELEGPDVEDEV